MKWIVVPVLSLVMVGVASAQYYPGDDSEFVGENHPDYSTVKAGEKITKEWKIRNTGSVEWKGRYLSRVGDPKEGLISDRWIPIKDTKTGQICTLEVSLTMPSKAGTYKAEFKMVELEGAEKKEGKVIKTKKEILLFPKKKGVFVILRVE